MKSFSYTDILNRIAARRPLLMLDRVAIADDGRSATGLKAVSMDEHFFQGHFPGEPIMPGVLQVAAMTQLAAMLLLETLPAPAGSVPWLRSISRYRFRKPVLPGDILRVEVQLQETTADGIKITGKVFTGTDAASDGQLELIYIPESVFLAMPPIVAASNEPSVVDIKKIMHHIPHRFPFLLMDRVTALDHGACTVSGLKNVTGNESFMAGVSHPSMPGFLQVEAAAQAACVWALSLPENASKLGLFAAIDKAIFHLPALPGDQLKIDMTLKNGRIGSAWGTIKANGTVLTEIEVKFALVDRV
jgi:3-hydroxymyristoyl/3-hydroxydecanoyl-(acyl carrier protein) dehydratase